MRALATGAAGAALLGVLACSGCLQDASRRGPSPTPPGPLAIPSEARASGAAFVDAVARYERGDLASARSIFVRLIDEYPVLADYHLAYLAAIDDRRGRPQEASAWDDRLLAAHPESVWIPTALARRARTALALGEARAEELAERARLAAGDDVSARGVALAVQAAIRAPTRPREAYELYQAVRRDGGEAAARAREACRELETRHPELLGDAALLLAEGRLLTSEGRLEAAGERLERAAARGAGAERVDALRALAKVRQQEGRLEDALAAYRAAVAAGPMASLAPFELASLLWNRDRDAEARPLFAAIVAERPAHPKAETAQYALARIAEQDGRTTEAERLFRRLADEGGESDLAREARWRLAWMPYARGDLPEADAAFARLGDGSAKDRAASLYWRARILARTDRVAESRELFAAAVGAEPDGYYAELAEHRLGVTDVAPPAPEPAPLDLADPASLALHAFHWSRSRALHDLGLNAAAARELAALARELPDGGVHEPLLLPAYSEVEAYDRALRLAHRIGDERLAPETLAAYRYPRAFWVQVTTGADAARLDPYLVLALMRQESAFDPRAVSPAAAYGLMQLLERTASHVAGGPIERTALFDPATNIALGTRYLRQLLDRFGGDLPKALAAYNGGEGAVEKWERRAPGAASDEFVETISYRETRHYVKQVLGNYRRYRRLYGAPGERRRTEVSANGGYGASATSSAATSFDASPPKPPFDISTTTSPGRA